MVARATSPPFYDGLGQVNLGSGSSSGSGSGTSGSGLPVGGKSMAMNVIFPNFALEDGALALRGAWFWTALLLQVSVCVGFFRFFRKEQLAKP